MNIELIYALLSAILFIGYITFISKNWGVIHSISDSYYLLEEKKKGTGIYFTVWTGFTSFLLIPSLLLLTKDNLGMQIISTVSCMGLIFVGAAPKFKTAKYNIWHSVGAILAALGACAISIYLGCWIEIIIILILCMVIQYSTKTLDFIYWGELGVLTSLFYSIFINYEKLLF